MKLRRFCLIAINALLLTASITLSGATPVKTTQLVASSSDDIKSQAERLFQQMLQHFKPGEFDEAIELGMQALKLYQVINSRIGEANTLGNIGVAYRAKNDYMQSLIYLDKSLQIMQEIQNHQGEWTALQQLGLTNRAVGNYTKAKSYLEKQVDISNSPHERAASLANLGLIEFDLGNYSAALRNMHEQLKIAQDIQRKDLEETAYFNLGLVYETMGKLTEALDYYYKALQAKRTRNAPLGDIQGHLALVYRAQGHHEIAIVGLRQYLAEARASGDRRGEWVALNNLGVTLYELGNVAEATQTLYSAIQVQESLRERLDDPNKISIFETQAPTYGTLQLALIDQNKISEALEIAERGRARAFVDLLENHLKKNYQEKISSPKIEQIQQIARQSNAILVEYSVIHQTGEIFIWVIHPSGEIKFSRKKLQKVLADTSLGEFVENSRVSLIKNRYIASRNSDRGVQSLVLKQGDRIRFKDDLRNWDAWEVVAVDNQNGKVTVRQPSYDPGVTDSRLITDISEIIGATPNASSPNAKSRNLQQLYQLLISPIADLLPSDPNVRVIFIPQRELFYVPFAALQDNSGKYLIEKHTILTAPSIQVLQLTRTQKQQLPSNIKDVLVVGNPIMPKVARHPGEPPQQLPPLPEAEKEALAIASFLKTQALIGKDATKAAILPLLPKAKIIHLATHGLLDDIVGLGSAIALAPSGNDNGLLTAEEILDFKEKLSASLVVLSACDTGGGRITGDGVIGLSRSLIAAGVPSVIVSLWSVPDAPTASLMTEFYQQLQQNPDKARALRQSMLKTMKEHPNPRDWAAFTLIGEAL